MLSVAYFFLSAFSVQVFLCFQQDQKMTVEGEAHFADTAGALMSLDLVTFDRLHKSNGSFPCLLDIFTY